MGSRRLSAKEEESDPLELFLRRETKCRILTALVADEVELAEPKRRGPGHG